MEFRYSKSTALMALLIGIPGLATCYLLVVSGSPDLWPWIGVIAFGLMAVTGLWRLIHTSPVVRIDQRGILDTRLKAGVISWGKIDEIRFMTRNDSLLLMVPDTKLVEPSPLQSGFFRLPGAAVLASPDLLAITIRFKGLNPGVGEAWDYIRTNYPGKAHEGGPVDGAGSARHLARGRRGLVKPDS